MIYLDNHATTPCDPRVVQQMLPWFTEQFANPHSGSHEWGRSAADVVDQSAHVIANFLGAPAESVVFTSGATESTNLALRGICLHPRQKRRHIVTVTSEHPAVGDVATDLQRDGIKVTRLGVDHTGTINLDQLAEAVDDQTAVVSVMWANNEIGTIAPIREIAQISHAAGALVHSDATQAVGRIPVRMVADDIDLISMSAHKCYGPKGIGLLVAGNGQRRVRLRPQIVGGGQQRGLRSGTVNPAGVVALAAALQICDQEMNAECQRIAGLRWRLWDRLTQAIGGLELNGVPFDESGPSPNRLAGNLNFVLPHVEGDTWLAGTPEVAFSSGSACSSAEAAPSHVLSAIGRSESEARRSVRFGIGRFNTKQEIDEAANLLAASYETLKQKFTG